MPKTVLRARYGVTTLAALASLAIVAAPIQMARGDKPSTPVTVVNPEDIAKAQGIQQPYQARPSCQFTASLPFVCGVTIQAPASQRLVIEFVSGRCQLLTNVTVFEATIDTFAGGIRAGHFLAVQAPFLDQPSTISQQVRIYADQSSDIFLNVSTNGNNSPLFCEFSVSGQAVAVP